MRAVLQLRTAHGTRGVEARTAHFCEYVLPMGARFRILACREIEANLFRVDLEAIDAPPRSVPCVPVVRQPAWGANPCPACGRWRISARDV